MQRRKKEWRDGKEKFGLDKEECAELEDKELDDQDETEDDPAEDGQKDCTEAALWGAFIDKEDRVDEVPLGGEVVLGQDDRGGALIDKDDCDRGEVTLGGEAWRPQLELKTRLHADRREGNYLTSDCQPDIAAADGRKTGSGGIVYTFGV